VEDANAWSEKPGEPGGKKNDIILESEANLSVQKMLANVYGGTKQLCLSMV
jgi:hypothetical protein